MSPTGAPTPRQPAVPVRHRPSVAELTAPQLAELRAAFDAVQRLDDERGFQYHAGIHGLPLPMYCDQAHGQPAFLPWHRAYLYRFEQALRDTGHDVMLPWWDWTVTREIPAAYNDPQDPDGQRNPLYSVRINETALRQGARGLGDERTVQLSREPDTAREPGLPGTRLPSTREIERVLEYDDFASFTGNLEDYHGNVHIWVGGHMTDIPFAAYDPIFWAHHCMIDRLWRIWQLEHTQASFPVNVTGEVMQPFNLTAEEVLDPTALGYDYALSATQVEVPA